MLRLSENSFRCHLPQFVQRQRRYGRDESVIRVYFPTYLFVAFDPDADPWGRILRFDRLVRRIFTSAPGRPMALRDGEIERMMAMGRAGDGVVDPDATAMAPLDVGQKVRIRDGAFRDWTGICKWSAADRIGVLMTMFGGERVVPMARIAAEAA